MSNVLEQLQEALAEKREALKEYEVLRASWKLSDINDQPAFDKFMAAKARLGAVQGRFNATIEDCIDELLARVGVQSKIGAWHVETYGATSPDRIYGLYSKLDEETAELLDADDRHAPEEAADCVIVLFALAHRMGFDLMEEVAKKFEIVRNRDQRGRDIAKGLIKDEPLGVTHE